MVFLDTLKKAARNAGVDFRYGAAVQALQSENGRVTGLVLAHETIAADAVVLACGGFQGNGAMMQRAFRRRRRDDAADLAGHALQHRRRHPHGAGGSAPRVAGDWNGMHAEPVDAR